MVVRATSTLSLGELSTEIFPSRWIRWIRSRLTVKIESESGSVFIARRPFKIIDRATHGTTARLCSHAKPSVVSSETGAQTARARAEGGTASSHGPRRRIRVPRRLPPARVVGAVRPRAVVVARACVDQPREDDDAPRHRPKPLATAATPLALDASLTRSILLVGDGDLSFSLALARRAPNARITATTFEPYDAIVSDWGGDENIRELRALPNVEDVLHSVDATRLHTRASPLHEIGANERTGNANDDRKRWDRVLFMFPHIAGKGKSVERRPPRFFQSVGAVLAPFGVVEVGLVAGQGGTPADGVHRPGLWQHVDGLGAGGEGRLRVVRDEAVRLRGVAPDTRTHRRGTGGV